jgi:N-acetylglucosamine-6-phosphate deacetylase
MADPITKIQNCRLIRDGEIVYDDVLFIQSGKIINAQDHFYAMGIKPSNIIDAQGLIVAPGYIDVQINGAFGVDFSDWLGKEKMKEDLDKVARKLLKFGCTSFAPTIVSSEPEIYHKVKDSNFLV